VEHLSRAATAIESPYDTQARHSNKHDLSWLGYKVHLSETCDPDLPRLVTHVHTTAATTAATTQDVSCTAAIHQALAAKELLPTRHLVDTGYVDAELLVESYAQHGVELFGPTRFNPSWQALEGGYDLTHFTLCWKRQQAQCPQGKTSVYWHRVITQPYGRPVVRVRFSRRDCTPCPQRDRCVRSSAGRPRQLVVPDQPYFDALQDARTRITTQEGRAEYRQRAGIEGAISQAVRRCGLRRARYRGLAKTRLQHIATAAALNVVRTVEYLNGRPLSPTRTSRFARLVA
jgi:transposase